MVDVPASLVRSVKLLHSGPLSNVVDLKATINASSVSVLWSAPFSLDVTGVDPDTWYSVLIYNVTYKNNPTAILCTDCINITETHYTFTPDYLSPCHVFNYSVIPMNGAGLGESNTVTVGGGIWNYNMIIGFCCLFPGIKLSREEISAANDSKCHVAFNITVSV